MKRGSAVSVSSILFIAIFVSSYIASAQTQSQAADNNLTKRSISAIGYQVGEGGSKVDLKGTDLMPAARGEAKVEIKNKAASSTIQISVKNLAPPSKLGAEFLTYVLWVVTPDGRTGNSGEILLDSKGEGSAKVTSPAQTFSLIVTAEPYFAVRMPSEMVVLQSEIRKDTKGKIFPVHEYQLIKRAQYQKLGNPLALIPDTQHVPLEVYEARNAVDIAKSNSADKYAAEILSKAEGSLQMTEKYVENKTQRSTIVSTARQTVQFAEDARALSLEKQEEERIANEREQAAAAAKAQAEAKAAVEAEELKRKAAEEAAEAKQKADEEARRQAEIAAAKEEVLRVKEQAARDEAERNRKAAEQLRAQLLEQFNRILETRDTPRGLVVNLGDVLFDTGKFNLRSEAREKLAKLSGIVLAHPGLQLEVEGHTDSVGSDDLNQKLSEQRATAVQTYLIGQSLDREAVSAKGFGKTQPVADNATASGRQLNRRVEIIVSGEVIGQKIGT